MAISKTLKQQLIQQYVADLSAATNAIVVQQSGIPVTTATQVRKDIKSTQWKYVVVRKRLFLRALKEAWLPEIAMEDVPWSIVLVTSTDPENQYGPLKAVNTILKDIKKDDNGASYTFLGGWFDKVWKDGEYVNELANIPSKEELIAKLMFLLKHPMQSLASVVDQIAQKNGEAAPQAEEIPVAEGESLSQEDVSQDPVQEEAPAQEENSEKPQEDGKQEPSVSESWSTDTQEEGKGDESNV